MLSPAALTAQVKRGPPPDQGTARLEEVGCAPCRAGAGAGDGRWALRGHPSYREAETCLPLLASGTKCVS